MTRRPRPSRGARAAPLILLSSLLLDPSAVSAQDDDFDDEEEVDEIDEAARARAIEMLRRSSEHYEAGNFVTAADILEEAYRVFPEPTLLFNAARAYEGAGRLEEAISHYDRYLMEAGDIEDRATIERHVEELNEQLRAGSTPPTPAPTPPAGPGIDVDPIPWTIAGVGAAALIVGAIIGALAEGRRGDAEAEEEHRRASELQQEAFDLASGANAAFLAGGVLVLGGVMWGIVSLATATPRSASNETAVLRF